MSVLNDALLLRIYVGHDRHYKGHPLHEAIVLKAREMHLAGATVLRGGLGYGHSSRLHKGHLLSLSDDLPMVIEIVDSEDKVRDFVAVLDGMIESGLVTLEKVKSVSYARQGARVRSTGAEKGMSAQPSLGLSPIFSRSNAR